MPGFNGVSHIGLTVRDMRVSAGWYERVLGLDFVREIPVTPGGAGIPRILLRHKPTGLLVSVCEHADGTGEAFDPRRTGLDHIALEVADRAELDSWMVYLDDLGLDHSPVRDLGNANFVSLEDPDGIQIELWLPVIPDGPAANR